MCIYIYTYKITMAMGLNLGRTEHENVYGNMFANFRRGMSQTAQLHDCFEQHQHTLTPGSM